MEPVSLASIVQRAWRILRDESPEHHRMAEGIFAEVFVSIEVDGERVMPSRARDEGGRELQLSTTPATLLAVVGGDLTLVEALEEGRLDGRGSATAISAAERGMTVFVHGLARAPSGPRVLDDLRRWRREKT